MLEELFTWDERMTIHGHAYISNQRITDHSLSSPDSVLFSQSNPSSSSLPVKSSLHPATSSASLNTSDRKGKSRASPLGQGTSVSAPGSGRGSSDFLALDMDGDGGENGLGRGGGGGGYQQMQLMEQQVGLADMTNKSHRN